MLPRDRVNLIVALQLIYVITDIVISITVPEIRRTVKSYLLAYTIGHCLLLFLIYFTIIYCDCAKYESPYKYITILLLTLFMFSFSCAMHVLYYKMRKCLIICIGISVLVVIIVMCIVSYLPDTTVYAQLMRSCFWFFIVIEIASSLLLEDSYKFHEDRIVLDIFQWISFITFLMYFIYDLQRMAGGYAEELPLNDDEVIFFAAKYFFDICILYMLLLRAIYECACDRPQLIYLIIRMAKNDYPYDEDESRRLWDSEVRAY